MRQEFSDGIFEVRPVRTVLRLTAASPWSAATRGRTGSASPSGEAS